MSGVDPDGPLIVSITAIRQMLLDCHFWGTLIDEGNTEQGQVFIDSLPLPASGENYTRAELEDLRPFAIINQAAGDGYHVESLMTGTTQPQGHLEVRLEVNIPDAIIDDDHEIALFALRTFGRIIRTGDANKAGLLDLSGRPERPFIRKLTVSDYYRPSEQFAQQHGEFVACDLDIYWGFVR